MYNFEECLYHGQTNATLTAQGIPAISVFNCNSSQLLSVPTARPSTVYITTEDELLD